MIPGRIFPFLVALLCMVLTTSGIAQQTSVTLLFQNQQPLEIHLEFSIKEVKKITNDTIYTPTWMRYKNDSGSWDSLKMDIRARGEYRRKNCFFPPLRIKMKKKETEGTVFAGNKDLKLVLPCQQNKSSNDLILKEYIGYKLYEPVTPYFFHTRLVDITLTDRSGKHPQTYTLKGIFIEDDDLVARRFHAKMVKDDFQLHPLRLQDTTSTIHDFFQYMIANTDWSSIAQHNIKVMQLNEREYIPLSYDFDMSGLVNAPYATTSETLDIVSVRQRVYRGFCRTDSIFYAVRDEYLKGEEEIMHVFDAPEIAGLNPKDLSGCKKFTEEFFLTLKDDKQFKENILSKCRTK